MKKAIRRQRKARYQYYARLFAVCLAGYLVILWAGSGHLWPSLGFFLGWSLLVFGLWEFGERRRDREFKNEGLT